MNPNRLPPPGMPPAGRCPFKHGAAGTRATGGARGQIAYAENATPLVADEVERTTRKWTWDEIAKHNTRQSAWMVLHGKVYDVTDYLDKHPGGSSILLQFCGKDATKQYLSVHPWINHANIIGHRQVGVVASERDTPGG